jgi:hypothetical protein
VMKKICFKEPCLNRKKQKTNNLAAGMKKYIMFIAAVLGVAISTAQVKKPSSKKPVQSAPKDDNKPIRYISLPARVSVHKPSNFYIAGVIDATGTKDTIGVATRSKNLKQKLVLQGGTMHFFTTLLDSMLVKDTTLYPVVLKVNEFSINEIRERFNDKSEISYAYEFLSVYKNDTIKLASYNGGGHLVNYMYFKKNYDTAFSSMPESWKVIESNLAELEETHKTFIKGVLFSVNLVTTQTSDDTLVYSGQGLTFEDFKANPQMQNGAAAHMFIDYTPEVSYSKGVISVNIDLSTVFNKKRSWLSGEGRKPEVLQHFSHRLKLLHLYTLLLKDKLEKAVPTIDNYKTLLQELYGQVSGEALQKMEQYDDETQYGTKIREQLKWEQKINNGLPLN